MILRNFSLEDIDCLREVFYSSVHGLGKNYYTKRQLQAWAPKYYDKLEWKQKIIPLNPFIAEVDGKIAGYADLQDTGLIDHFYVAAPFARRGIGTALIEHIHNQAYKRQINNLYAFVSRAAEEFFTKFEFEVKKRQSFTINGSSLQNALMTKTIKK